MQYVNYYVNKQQTSYAKNSRMSGPTIESESGIYKNSLSLQPLNFEKTTE